MIPVNERPEIVFNPDIIDTVGFSLQMDMPVPDPLTDTSPWRFGLDCYVGHYLIFEMPNTARTVWRIIGVDRERQALIGRWPD